MITREFLKSLNFRIMDESDRMGFAGCESPVSLIAEYGTKYLVIIDGSYCEVCDVDELEVVDSCDDIRELPYTHTFRCEDVRPGNPEYFASDL
jgi:hypothetical protein